MAIRRDALAAAIPFYLALRVGGGALEVEAPAAK